jgi:hypothetical protein
MKTTVSIDEELLKEAKVRAIRQKTTVAAVVNEALRLGLFRIREQAAATSNPPLKIFRGNGLQNGVDLHSSADLLVIMEEP